MKISFGLRFVTVFLALVAVLSWLFVNQALDQVKTGIRQSAETTLVDMAQLLAAGVEADIGADGRLQTARFERQMQAALGKSFRADIYQLQKQHLDLHVYITDRQGRVHYDSQGRDTGRNYANWQDVARTLRGEYGARTSYIDPARNAEGDPKHMVVAAPLRHQGEIVGVLSVVQPVQQFDIFRLSGARQLRYVVFGGLLLALVIIVLMSAWLTHALGRLSGYAEAMAANRPARAPGFNDPHFARLSHAIAQLRRELDGKQYVEQYIHGLTHELKTPLTGIRAAGELLQEDDLSRPQQQRLVTRILAANQRMQDLVARMLLLAKLENRDRLHHTEAVPLHLLAAQCSEDYAPQLAAKNLHVHGLPLPPTWVTGDPLLLSQALDNLLANALAFCPAGGTLRWSLQRQAGSLHLQLHNQGDPIPDYALPRLSERFFSLPRPDGSGRSSGLGLSFVAQIMSLHGGQLQIGNRNQGVLAELVFPPERLQARPATAA